MTIYQFIVKACSNVCLLVAVVLHSCSKKDDTPAIPHPAGTHQITGYVVHHQRIIPNASVFLKQNVTEFPGTDTSLYERIVQCDQQAKYQFEKLNAGNYYLYSTGYDTAARVSVTGGIPIIIGENEPIKEIDVPVTE
jgi:hypothetical protein